MFLRGSLRPNAFDARRQSETESEQDHHYQGVCVCVCCVLGRIRHLATTHRTTLGSHVRFGFSAHVFGPNDDSKVSAAFTPRNHERTDEQRPHLMMLRINIGASLVLTPVDVETQTTFKVRSTATAEKCATSVSTCELFGN